MTTRQPVLFEEFFELGLPDTASPFLTPDSRRWGKDLDLRCSLLAAGFLITSFIFSFFPFLAPASHICLLFVYFLTGIPSLIHAVYDLSVLNVNIDVLMTLAAFSSVFIGGAMEGGLLLVLFAISGSMEEMVANRAKGAISALKELSPKKGLVIGEGGELLERSVQDIKVGSLILVRAGEVIPLDGIVVEGGSLVDLVHLTGEAKPFPKKVGDQVPAGGRTTDGSLTLRVLHGNTQSTLAKIIQLVTEAQEARPRLQRAFDRFSSTYAMTIISLATLFALTFPFLLSVPFLGKEGSIYRALAFLIAASPCALIIAIPTAYLSAISSCAKKGILLKGGIALDALASCSQMAFDKTGTLTTGQLNLIDVNPLDRGQSIDEALKVASGLERGAKHPIAQAIVDWAKENGIEHAKIADFKQVPGYGVEGIYQEKPVFIGNPDYLQNKRPDLYARLEKELELIKQRGEVNALLLIGEQLYLFRFADQIRADVKPLLEKLKDRGLKLFMLTGDHHESAKRVAEELGFDHYFADLKPEDKLYRVSRLSESGNLAMVGDGINDAPAMARAQVAIAMGQVGSAAAMEASDMVLLHDNITLLDWLVAKAKATRRIVLENLTLASLAIIIASTPALAGLIPLWLAVVLHEGGTVLVGLNALRLLKR